jgi:VanZ family protein
MHMALLRRLDPWMWPLALMGAIFALSSQPSLDSGLGLLDTVGRKLVHFAEYGLLALLWWRVFRSHTAAERAVLAALLVSSLYAVTDEWHQSFVEGRSGNPVDWAIDTAGAATALLLLRSRTRA